MKTSKSPSGKAPGWIAAVVLFVVLAVLFWKCFLPDYVLFSNDGPLGLQMSAWLKLPQAFLGQWYDLNSIGVNAGASLPDISNLILWVFGPVGYAKFLTPISLWFLGVSAYFFARRLEFSRIVSAIVGLTACLTTGFFTNACWGAAPPIIAWGTDFLALGALVKRDKLPFWVAPALAGLAVGLNVMQAADIGALFSIMIAAFVFYQSIAESESFVKGVVRGVGRTVIVAGFALFIAAYAVFTLIGANISGIAGTKQDERTKAERYDFATQWSMPKRETLALIVPNLFGCNVVAPGEKNYWGGLGTDPAWDRYFESGQKPELLPGPGHFIRHTGRGIYLGTLVVLVAIWASLQSFRKKDSVFTPTERKLVWFWFAVAVVSLLFAYGRYAPFYRLIYTLPYFSTIRNPDKFLHFVTFASIILFGYGLHGLSRRYLDVPQPSSSSGRFKSWWSKAATFDKAWVVGSVFAVLLSIVGWGLYAGMRGHVENFLAELQRVDSLRNGGREIDMSAVHEFVASQVSFSLHQVGWFILVLAVSAGLLLLIFSGSFAGPRARVAGILLGVILVVDFARANLPYIIFWNYKEKYEANSPEPVIEFLRKKPYEHRVAYGLPWPMPTPQDYATFKYLYDIEWTQQLFPFYDIQTLDIVQMPRTPEDLEAFNSSLRVGIKTDANGNYMLDDTTFFRLARLWELTSTRYVVGPAIALDLYNRQADSGQQRFRFIQRFEMGARPGAYGATTTAGMAAALTDNGRYALFEFTGALPRASLFSHWEVKTNETSLLEQLTSRSFNPAQTVLVSKALPTTPTASSTNQNSAAEIVSYEPADVKVKANPATPSILMLTDKYDESWQVRVDGKPAELLKCNFIMHGVYLEPGQHEVEFKFRPHINLLYVTVAAIFVGFGLLGYAIVTTRKNSTAAQ